ncbi:hypothetical protein [Rheinheimera sp.]|uniref:hypothetical protein n=1 Tax=Rheinheimera sp. TaxID=1869214 RepID=UPI002733C42B|nr:hypothetical protein [Rheinheimera sp.]MDP2714234.1 hypothetical protein [Rheinheimera sp.]
MTLLQSDKNMPDINNYWLVDDKNWLAQRKASWDALKATIKHHYSDDFKSKTLKAAERYFIRGEVIADDYDEPLIDWFFQIAWHPSDDEQVWLAWLLQSCRQFDPKVLSSFWTTTFFNTAIIRPEKSDVGNSLFVGREQHLVSFLFENEQLEEKLTGYALGELRKQIILKLIKDAADLIKKFSLGLPAPENGSCYFASLPVHALSHAHNIYSSTLYLEAQKKNWRYWQIQLDTNAEVYANLQRYTAQQQQVVETWVAQIEQSAPEWQAAWREAKKAALALAESVTESAAESDSAAIAEVAVAEIPPQRKAGKPSADDLKIQALKTRLMGMGCPASVQAVDNTYPDVLEAAAAGKTFFPLTSINENDGDVEPPYTNMLQPLRLLCEWRGGHEVSYRCKNDKVLILLDGEPFAKVDLTDEFDIGVLRFAADVVALAQQWFTGQVFCSLRSVYILPADLVQHLEQDFADINDGLDYYAKQLAEESE